MLPLLVALTSPAMADVRVVASLPDLAAVAQQVGGDHVTVTAMALPTQDPHFVDAKPNLALALSRADLLLLVGLDMEIGWLPTLVTASRNPRIQKGTDGYVDCSHYVQVLDVPAGPIDRTMGDLHGGGNPHYFYDPRAMVAVAHGIAQRLAAVDPDNTADYQAGAVAFEAAISQARPGWEERLAPLRGAAVIGYHHSWTYLADWLGFEVVADVEPKPGIPPAPAHVAKVVGAAQQRNVSVVLIESFYPDTTARLVADKGGANLVKLTAGTDFASGETYPEHIDAWVDALAIAGGGP